MARLGLSMQKVAPVGELATKLYNTRRFVHAAIATGKGTDMIHVISVYGYPNAARCREARAANEDLIRDVMLYVAMLGDVPVFLCGDWNTHVEASHSLHKSIGFGQIYDLEATFVKARGADPQVTCVPKETSVGTRVDMFFVMRQPFPW